MIKKYFFINIQVLNLQHQSLPSHHHHHQQAEGKVQGSTITWWDLHLFYHTCAFTHFTHCAFYSLSVLLLLFFLNITLFLCSFLLCLTQVVQNILDTERAHVSELQVSFNHQLFFCHLVYIKKCTWLTLWRWKLWNFLNLDCDYCGVATN